MRAGPAIARSCRSRLKWIGRIADRIANRIGGGREDRVSNAKSAAIHIMGIRDMFIGVSPALDEGPLKNHLRQNRGRHMKVRLHWR